MISLSACHFCGHAVKETGVEVEAVCGGRDLALEGK